MTKKTLIISSAMLAVYAVLTFIGAINHEIWFDEGQAWCIARDNDIAGIIDQMKYEGHPPLWHFILYPFAQLGCSVDILPLISWFFSVVTVALILWKSPFHISVNASVILSCGFLFYNSITSRVYCLIPLFLSLIAIIYPKRGDHPLVFGLLVACLANTHVMMSGLVGILGIYMIIDLVKNFKTSVAKQNIFRLCGLAIAGIGVVMLVLPLIQSLGVSKAGSERVYDLYNIMIRIFDSLFNIGLYLLPVESVNVAVYLICYMFSAFVLIMLVVLRHYRGAFVSAIVFTSFFVLATQVIYNVMHTTRAAVYIYTLFFIFWIARSSEKSVQTNYNKLTGSSSSIFINKILTTAIRLDKNYDKTLSVMLTAIMLFSVPRGIYALFSDYTNEFCVSRSTTEFIKKEIPEDSVIVTNNIYCAQMSAYSPDTVFYTLRYQDFITHTTFSVTPEKINWEKVYNDLKGFNNVYYLAMNNDFIETGRDNVIFTAETKAEGIVQLGWVEITRLDVEKEILPLVGTESISL